jgi:hypothetical protein
LRAANARLRGDEGSGDSGATGCGDEATTAAAAAGAGGAAVVRSGQPPVCVAAMRIVQLSASCFVISLTSLNGAVLALLVAAALLSVDASGDGEAGPADDSEVVSAPDDTSDNGPARTDLPLRSSSDLSLLH